MLYLFKHNNKYLTRYGLLVIIEGYRPTCTRSSPNRTCFMFSNACSSSDSLWVSNPMGSDQSQKRDCQVPPDCWHLEKWQQVCRKRGRSRLTEREVAHTYCHRSTYAKDSWATWRDYFHWANTKQDACLWWLRPASARQGNLLPSITPQFLVQRYPTLSLTPHWLLSSGIRI
jgi:hypothetical protein